MIFGKSTSKETNTAELRKYIPNINTTYDYEKFRNFIDSSYKKYILPIISPGVSTKLIAYYKTGISPDEGSGSGSGSGSDSGSGSGSTVTDKWTSLLELCQYALANLSFFHGFHLLNIKIGDKGIYVTDTDETRGTYKYEETAFMEALQLQGYNTIDEVLVLLENNTSVFSDWVDSDSYTILNENLIRNVYELTLLYPKINNSRLVFLNIKPYIQITEDFTIRPGISNEYFDELIAEFREKTVSADNAIIISSLQKSLAYYSISKALDELNLNVLDQGVYFNVSKSIEEKATENKNVTGIELIPFIQKLERNGLMYLDFTKGTLNKSDDDQYPTYKASDSYHDGVIRRTHTQGTKSFRV